MKYQSGVVDVMLCYTCQCQWNHYHFCHYGPLPFYQRSTVFVSPMIMEKKTNDFGEGNGFSSHLQRDCTWTDQCRKVLWDRTCGFSSSSEKTRKSNRSQMSLQRQHFLLIYLKILSVGPAGVWTRDLPLRGPALYQLTELTRRRLINQYWSKIQSKNYGDNSLMSQECTEALCSFHVKGTKWNREQIKPLIINAILFIFFEPAIVVNRYMTCALFNWILKKKLSFFKKNLSSEKKKPWVLKKTWVLKTSEFF